jgi:hypothetical protein
MLPKHIADLLEEQITTDLQAKGSSDRDITQRALGRWSASGSGFSPKLIKANALVEEIEVRVKAIATAIRTVLTEVKVSPYNGFVDDLVGVYQVKYDAIIGDLRAMILDLCREAGIQGDGGIQAKLEKWHATYRMEVKLLASAIMEPALRPGTVSISVSHSQVGAIQTGAGSSVGTGIANTKVEITQLTQALSQVRDGIDKIAGLEQVTREELREVVIEAEAEAKKTKPNKTRLSALLSLIVVAIKNVDTLKEWYHIIAGFLRAYGVEVIS